MVADAVVFTGFIGRLRDPGRFKVHRAPLPRRCCFFLANDPAAKGAAAARGWTFVLLPDIPLSDNKRFNSVQSKKLKFLQVKFIRRMCAERAQLRHVVWVDHKRHLRAAHVTQLLSHLRGERCPHRIAIRSTPRHKTSVWQEFRESNWQPRYRAFKEATQRYLAKELSDPGVSANHVVMNTGLIAYWVGHPRGARLVRKLANDVYACVRRTGNPMCQIFWMIEAQKFPKGFVKVIPYRDVPA